MLDWIREFVDFCLSEFWEVTRTKGEGLKSYARMNSSPTNIVVAHFADRLQALKGTEGRGIRLSKTLTILNATEQI